MLNAEIGPIYESNLHEMCFCQDGWEQDNICMKDRQTKHFVALSLAALLREPKYTNTQMQKYTIHNICMKDRQTRSLVQIILSPNNYINIYEYN